MLEELFDTAVISAEVGLHKPQPEIYRLAAERLVVPPEECVFVDDLRENCAGAEAVGMTAILHRDPAESIGGSRSSSGSRWRDRHDARENDGPCTPSIASSASFFGPRAARTPSL